MRLDKYLKLARIIKRRTVANEACSAGRVQINGRVAKPSSEVKAGDAIAVSLSGRTITYKVLAVAQHATKEDAAGLYEVIGQEDDA